jgi:type IV secretion system protein VirB8
VRLFKKKPASAKVDPVLAPQPDGAAVMGHGVWAKVDPYAYKVAHRRLAWLLRLSVGTNIALAASVVALVGGLTVLLPLKEVRPAFITLAGSEDQIVKIEPIEKTVAGFELLLEAMGRQYVKNLLEIDTATQVERWRAAFRMTGTDLTARFKRERIENGAIQKAIDSGLEREIIIQSASKAAVLRGVYTVVVDFIQVDRRHGEEVERKPLRAYLSMTTAPQQVKGPEVYTNPLGVVVKDMSLKEREAE